MVLTVGNPMCFPNAFFRRTMTMTALRLPPKESSDVMVMRFPFMIPVTRTRRTTSATVARAPYISRHSIVLI